MLNKIKNMITKKEIIIIIKDFFKYFLKIEISKLIIKLTLFIINNL